MTLRAFLIGVLAAAGLSLLAPYTSFIKGGGWLTGGAFPNGPVVPIVFLTIVVNVLLKLVRRSWALRQAELMLVWCMLIVAAAIPVSGIGRTLYSLLAAGPYTARRTGMRWTGDDGVLTHTPEGLVLSTDPNSEAARQYFEGATEKGRVPWKQWFRPLLNWAVFLMFFYLSVFFLCGMFRRQWVESERLMFPLARIPLEFTEGSAGPGLLPTLLTQRPFIVGVVLTTAFRVLRAAPILTGGMGAWEMPLPFATVLAGTPLADVGFGNVPLRLPLIGLAFLVPADVSLSVWFFFLFSRVELLIGSYLALPVVKGNSWSALMRWQQFGAYVVFMLVMIYMARRHLAAVFRKALGLDSSASDRDEPVGYRFAFWGFLASVTGCMFWYWHFGVRMATGVVIVGLMLCISMVYARVAAQSGVPIVNNLWSIRNVLESYRVPGFLTLPTIVVANMQNVLAIGCSVLAPAAMNAFRISEVFKRRRRLLVPILLVAVLVAMAGTTHTVLTQAYSTGVLNFRYWPQDMGENVWGGAERALARQQVTQGETHFGPAFLGAGLMGFLMFMRARFYWWPIHAIGLLTCSTWSMVNRQWVPFFIGWACKVSIMKLAGGRALRRARYFFIAMLLTEAFFYGVSAIVRAASGAVVPRF